MLTSQNGSPVLKPDSANDSTGITLARRKGWSPFPGKPEEMATKRYKRHKKGENFAAKKTKKAKKNRKLAT
jgi:hypothetical protein